MAVRPLSAALGACLVLAAAAPAAAQPLPSSLTLGAPDVVATGTVIRMRGGNAASETNVAIERRRRGTWRRLKSVRSDRQGRFTARYRPRGRGRVVLRARSGPAAEPTAVSDPVRVRSRDIVLAAVGDINLGDGIASLMQAYGRRYPWTSAAPLLRRSDVAFGNLECAISRRGSPVPKQYNFRGSPRSLRVARRFAGLDVVNLANNHTGDFGVTALLDTIGYVRRFGMLGVGAGSDLARSRRPRVIKRLGLRIGFVGFSQILPASFFAGPGKPGTVFASEAEVRRGVRAAGRRADVVIATFHWGIERAPQPNGIQRSLARAALDAGATAVIGAHPHVLQPIRRSGHQLVAYSLGNFVFTSGGGATARTGVLLLRLSARGVEGARLRPATIVAGRPRLR